MPTRARSETAKAARRAEIVLAAQATFDAAEVEAFTMDDVAAKVGLSKAALYGYFPTREGLLLAALEADFAEWRVAADDAVRMVRGRPAVTDALASSLLARPRMMRLLAVLPSLLERNIPLGTARAFKESLVDATVALGGAIDTALGAAAGSGQHLLVRLHAAVVGLYHAAHPAPVIAQVLAEPEFAALRVDLRRELTFFINALAHGALSPTEKTP